MMVWTDSVAIDRRHLARALWLGLAFGGFTVAALALIGPVLPSGNGVLDLLRDVGYNIGGGGIPWGVASGAAGAVGATNPDAPSTGPGDAPNSAPSPSQGVMPWVDSIGKALQQMYDNLPMNNPPPPTTIVAGKPGGGSSADAPNEVPSPEVLDAILRHDQQAREQAEREYR
jgi:hypothetical protein